MYPAMAQAPGSAGVLLVKTAGDPRAVLPAVREAIWSVDPDLAPFDVETMGEALDASLAQERFVTILISAFAGLALVLALIGVYGVIAYSVAQRGREIGIRLALGASGKRVVVSVVGEGMRLAIVGGAIGLALAVAATRFLRSQLYGVSATDPITLGSGLAILLGIAALGSAIPALRASGMTPGDVLRES
jgi:putative ABC transport system permease protein